MLFHWCIVNSSTEKRRNKMTKRKNTHRARAQRSKAIQNWVATAIIASVPVIFLLAVLADNALRNV